MTLEPCCHQGRTPPCTELLLEKRPARVVIGSRDPNPLVAGKSVAILRAAGIDVERDVLREECDRLNPIFFHYIVHRTPYIALKYAMTADGRIACHTGQSRWVSNELSRGHVHSLRHRYRGVMVGVGTVLADDPRLNCRRPQASRDPVRIICDSRLRLPPDCQIVRTAREQPTIVACAAAPDKRRQALERAGVEVLPLPGRDGRVDLTALLAELGRREIDGVLVEGGAELNAALLEQRLVHRLYCYIAPKLFGGQTAKAPVGGRGAATPDKALRLQPPQIDRLGDDVLLTYDVAATDQDGGETACLPE